MPYVLRAWSVPADLEEVVSAELWEAGTLGCQVIDGGEGPLLAGGPLDGALDAGPGEAVAGVTAGSGAASGATPPRVVLVATFPEDAFDDPDPLAEWTAHGVEPLIARRLDEEDWLAAWRRSTRPFDLGRGYRVDPGEPESPAPGAGEGEGDRRLLRLPARQAFGVGSHESTRLAVELLEEIDLAGLDVVDVGTGTGILAFVALDRGAASAVAFDVDPAAAFAARDNAYRNRLDPRLYAGDADALADAAHFDWALVNVIPELILPALPGIAARVDGMVLSGILAAKGGEVLAAVRPLGYEMRARAEAGEWVAYRVERSVARVPPELVAGEEMPGPLVAAEAPGEMPPPAGAAGATGAARAGATGAGAISVGAKAASVDAGSPAGRAPGEAG